MAVIALACTSALAERIGSGGRNYSNVSYLPTPPRRCELKTVL